MTLPLSRDDDPGRAAPGPRMFRPGSGRLLLPTDGAVTEAGWDRLVDPPSRSRLTAKRGAFAPSLTVLGFAVIEYRGSEAHSEQWYYAPQLRVAETSGLGTVSVLTLQVSIPELGGSSLPVRFVGVRVKPGQSRDLIEERYGEYEVAYFALGLRAGAGTAGAVITYCGEDGHACTFGTRGPVTPGAMPTSFTRGRSSIVPMGSP